MNSDWTSKQKQQVWNITLATQISQEIDAPVIDGVSAAVKFVEALVGLGLGTSKLGDLAFPITKSYTGANRSEF